MEELENARKQLVLSRFYMSKPRILDFYGNEISKDDCVIDPNDIEFLNNPEDSNGIDYSIINIKYKGDTIRVALESIGNNTRSVMQQIKTEDGKEKYDFLLQDEIDEKKPRNIEDTLNPEMCAKTFSPKNFDELKKNIEANGKIVPENASDAIEMVQNRERYEKSNSYSQKFERDDNTNEDREEENEEAEEIKNAPKIPDEVKDEILKICEEKGLRVSQLKQILVVPATLAIEKGNNSGIRSDGGKVTFLRFSDGATKNIVVPVQDGKAKEPSPENNKIYSEYMSERIGKEVLSAADKDSKVVYTDEHGNTIVDNFTRKPNDLTRLEQEEFKKKWEELERRIQDINNSDLPEEEKANEKIAINDERNNLMKVYGVKIPIIEEEKQADVNALENTNEPTEPSEPEVANDLNSPNPYDFNDEDNPFYHYPTLGERNGPYSH